MQHLAVNVVGAFCFQFAAYVRGHYLNVVLKQVHVLENGIVDALQHIVGPIATLGNDVIGVVNESVAQRLDFLDGTFYLKLCQDAGSVDRIHKSIVISSFWFF